MGSDVECRMGDDVYAAFDGEVTQQIIPYNPASWNTCCNDGLEIQGTGQWAGKET